MSGTPTQAFRGSATTTPPTAAQIFRVPIPTADTEVPFALPVGTKILSIKALGNSKIRYAWALGESGELDDSWPISRGGERMIGIINLSATIYLQASSAGETIIIEAWT